MAQTDVTLSNLALRYLGSRKTLTSMADTTVEGVACAAVIDDCRLTMMRIGKWKRARKRAQLVPQSQFAISNATFVSSELIEITHAAADYASGDYVTITDIGGPTELNGTFEVMSAPATTTTRIRVAGVTTALTTAYTSGGYIRRSPAFGYAYMFALPSDFIRAIDVEFNDDWTIEGAYLLANSDEANLEYVYDRSGYTWMDPLMFRSLAYLMAETLCDELSASDEKKGEIHAALHGSRGKRGMLQTALFTDASEASLPTVEANDWIDAR